MIKFRLPETAGEGVASGGAGKPNNFCVPWAMYTTAAMFLRVAKSKRSFGKIGKGTS